MEGNINVYKFRLVQINKHVFIIAGDYEAADKLVQEYYPDTQYNYISEGQLTIEDILEQTPAILWLDQI